MINLLLLNNFYPVMSYRVQKKQTATNYCIRFWSLVMVRNQLPAQVVKEALTSFAGTTRHARREFFVPKLQYFLSFKYI